MSTRLLARIALLAVLHLVAACAPRDPDGSAPAPHTDTGRGTGADRGMHDGHMM